MNRNILIVLVGGALVAVLVAVLVQMSLSSGSAKSVASADVPKVQVVVAAKKISVGVTVTDSNMRWQEWPEDSVFSGAIVREGKKKPSEILEGRLLRNVAEGEPITKSSLISELKGNFLAASLAEGMRAVAVNVKADAVAGGFISPGDYVDVILTYKASIRVDSDDPDLRRLVEKNLGKMATETVLENVRVVAVDQAVVRSDDEKAKVGKTVTLEVDRKGGEIVALAKEMGKISLALRKLGDKTVAAKRPPATTDARITNIQDEVFDEVEAFKKSTGRDAGIVRIYSGASSRKVSVGR